MKPLETDVRASGNRLRDHNERFETLSEDIKVTQTCEIAGFVRKVSPRQYFRTIHDVGDGFGGCTGACTEKTLPRDNDYSETVGWIRGHEKIGPVIQVKVTYYSEHFGIEIQVKSMMNNESFSWIMISRGTNKYVEEVFEEKGVLSHHEEMTSGGGGKPIATEQVGQASPQSYPPKTFILTNGIGMIVPRMTMTKRLIGAPCYHCYAAILEKEFFEFTVAGSFATRTWQESCLDSGILIYLRAIQGHSGGTMVDPALGHVEIPFGWTISTTSGQDAEEGRQTVFFTMRNEPDEEYQELSRPRNERRIHFL